MGRGLKHHPGRPHKFKDARMPRSLRNRKTAVQFLATPVFALCLILSLPILPVGAQNPTPEQPAPAAVQSPQPSAPVAAAPTSAPIAAQPKSEEKPEAMTLAPPARNLPHDLSPWGMFLAADIIVKLVMIGLAFASVVTWTVWLVKSIELLAARQRAQSQLGTLAHAVSLSDAGRDLQSAKGPLARMVAATLGELERSADLVQSGGADYQKEGIKERAAALVGRIEARAGRQMNRGTGVLATIGATAPFVGLFGTVWGIMNSFIGISKTNTTNLAVVAPGIAEALLATAFGLVAAIPAVMIYNAFARSIASYRAVLGDGTAEVLRHLSRDLDRASQTSTREDWHVTSMRRSAE
jgi:biopolymer transport protein ExbB